MNRVRHCSLPRLRQWGWLCAVGLPLLGLGCAGQSGVSERFLVGSGKPAPSVQTSSYQPVSDIRPVNAEELVLSEDKKIKRLPITLDTVLRLAEEQNRQIGIGRERLNEAFAEKNIAAMSWVPNLYLGTSYYRHEGGIQNENGTFIDSSFGALFNGLELNGRFDVRDVAFQKINAERKVWQQKGELTKITSETLLEAANTYIDLLLARSSIATAKKMEQYHLALLNRAKKLAEADKAALILAESLESEMKGHRHAIVKVEQQANAAATKLAYLLGFDSTCVELVPVDPGLLPFDLVKADGPVCDLVALALDSGPGIKELERLLAIVIGGIEKMKSPVMMLPTIEVRMADGGFGAGPGGGMTWDNRYDLNFQARWNLNGLTTARDRQRVVQAKLEQVHLTYQDLRGKLTAGVQEAREAILSGRQQMEMSAAQIDHAQKAYKLGNERLMLNLGTTISEVLQTVRMWELAELTQLATIASYDKAQIRLMIFLGPAYNCQSAAPTGELRLPNPQEKRE